MCSYYETIDGARCDRAIVNACRDAVAGAEDDRISVENARKVFDVIANEDSITATERWTLYYCLTTFKWTDAAHDWIVFNIRLNMIGEEPPMKKARTGATSYYEVIDGMKTKRAIVDLCRDSVSGKGDGRVSVEDAKKIWAKALDGGKITRTERWTVRLCLTEFKWTRAAHDWVLEEISTVMQESEAADAFLDAKKDAAKAAEKAPVKTDSRGWEFHTESEGWTAFGDEQVIALNKAVDDGATSTEILIGSWKYLVDFKAMTQKNESSGRIRRIRHSGVSSGDEALKCKMGCGNKVNPGVTKRGNPFKTCCRTCAMEGHCTCCAAP